MIRAALILDGKAFRRIQELGWISGDCMSNIGSGY
jgi:hypothetical protein